MIFDRAPRTCSGCAHWNINYPESSNGYLEAPCQEPKDSRDRKGEPMDALRQIVKAWEDLPAGQHSPRAIEKWLRERMKPAIDLARAELGERK